MKHLFTALLCVATTTVFAQNLKTDTLKKATDTTKSSKKEKTFKFNFSLKDKEPGDSTSKHHKIATYPKLNIGLTVSRIDLGLSSFIDNGSSTLSSKNQFLAYNTWKTTNFGFDLLQIGVRFSDSFKLNLSGGFDWTYTSLKNNETILVGQPVLSYTQDNVNYTTNLLTASYLRVPLSFDFRTNTNNGGARFHFSAGPDMGFLLGGSVKQISDENGKRKVDATYHFANFRYGAFARIGYGAFGFFAKYYFNDVFINSPPQAGLKNFSAGLMLGF